MVLPGQAGRCGRTVRYGRLRRLDAGDRARRRHQRDGPDLHPGQAWTALEDTATLILQFANGAVGTAETGWCDPARTWQFRVHGTRGKLITPGHDGVALTRWEPGSYTREDEPAVPHAVDTAQDGSGDVHEHWLECVAQAGRQPELSNARAARHITEVLLAGLSSSRLGQRIPIHSAL